MPCPCRFLRTHKCTFDCYEGKAQEVGSRARARIRRRIARVELAHRELRSESRLKTLSVCLLFLTENYLWKTPEAVAFGGSEACRRDARPFFAPGIFPELRAHATFPVKTNYGIPTGFNPTGYDPSNQTRTKGKKSRGTESYMNPA